MIYRKALLYFSKRYIILIIVFSLLLFSCVYFGKKNYIFSIGGDSYSSLTWYNLVNNNFDFSLNSIKQFILGDQNEIPNPFFNSIRLLIHYFCSNQAIFFNIQLFVNLTSCFIAILAISKKILYQIRHKDIIILIFAISVTFSNFNLMHFFTGHVGFLPVFIIVWLYFLHRIYHQQNIKESFYFGIMSGAITVFNPYYGYFCMLLCIFIIVYTFIVDFLLFKKLYPYFSLSAAISLIIIVIFMYPVLLNLTQINEHPSGTVYKRHIDSVWGVLPWMYIIPSPQHIFSSEKYGLLYRKIMLVGNVPENSVYLGFISIVFFCYSFYLFTTNKLSPDLARYYRIILGLTIFCFLLSLPSHIPIGNGKKILWLSSYLHNIFPMFRIYSRFGFFVLIFFTLCAMIGLYYFLNMNRKYYKLIISVITFTLILDVALKVPVIDLNNYPKVYDWLKEQSKDFVIYEIPELKGKDDYIYYKYKYYQIIHGKKVFNRQGFDICPIYQANPDVFKKNNVKYIIQHKDYYQEGPIPYEHKLFVLLSVANEKFNNGQVEKVPYWFKIKKEFGDVIVYQVDNDI